MAKTALKNQKKEALIRLERLKRDLRAMSKLSNEKFVELGSIRELAVYVQDVSYILSLLGAPTKTKKNKETANVAQPFV